MQGLQKQLNSLKINTRPVQRTLLQSDRRHSFSGSETDISTSTENLTAEEKHVLYNGIRQEPQGEENNLNDEMDPSLSNTLIIHHNTPTDAYSSHFYSKKQPSKCGVAMPGMTNIYRLKEFNLGHPPPSPPLTPSPAQLPKYQPTNVRDFKLGTTMNMRRRSNGGSSIPPSPKSSPRRLNFQTNNENQMKTSYQLSGLYPEPDQSVQEITEIPKHYLDQSEVLKHLAKEVHVSGGTSRQPSPPSGAKTSPISTNNFDFSGITDYTKWHGSDSSNDSQSLIGRSGITSDTSSGNSSLYGVKKGHLRGSSNALQKRMSVSRSHPDLTNIGMNKGENKIEDQMYSEMVQRPKTHGRVSVEVDSETPSSQMLQMIEILSSDNAALKGELDQFHKKISKLQSFENEIQKVHESHEELLRSSDKRERLEKAIRARLEGEIRRLIENNRELREQLDAATSQLCKRPLNDDNGWQNVYYNHPMNAMVLDDDSELRRELSKRDVMIAQLLTQNKELLAEKDRHEIELQAQRATLQEQRNHIDILDNALTNAQTNVVRLEEENRKKQVYVDRVGTLQRALANLQLASDRRLQMEKRMRSQLEKEIENLRSEKEGKSTLDSIKYESSSTEDLKKMLRQCEEKIIQLEAEVSKWEQRYLEESTMRQIAVDAASVPKDVKIAALERTSQESEKLIAQARSEKLKHMDELYAAHRKSTELEGKIKDMESKLAERDAMIKVLQQHSQEKDAVLQNAVRGRPPRHSRAASSVCVSSSSSTTGKGHSGSASMGGATKSTGEGPGATNSLSSTGSSSATLHHRTGSKDEIGVSNIMVTNPASMKETSPLPMMGASDTLSDTKKTLEEQLKELDSRLSSKDSIISALRAEKEKYPNHFWRV